MLLWKKRIFSGKMEIRAVGENGYGKYGVLRALPKGVLKKMTLIYPNFYYLMAPKVILFYDTARFTTMGILRYFYPVKRNHNLYCFGREGKFRGERYCYRHRRFFDVVFYSRGWCETEEAKAQCAVSDYICPNSIRVDFTKQDMTELMAGVQRISSRAKVACLRWL